MLELYADLHSTTSTDWVGAVELPEGIDDTNVQTSLLCKPNKSGTHTVRLSSTTRPIFQDINIILLS